MDLRELRRHLAVGVLDEVGLGRDGLLRGGEEGEGEGGRLAVRAAPLGGGRGEGATGGVYIDSKSSKVVTSARVDVARRRSCGFISRLGSVREVRAGSGAEVRPRMGCQA